MILDKLIEKEAVAQHNIKKENEKLQAIKQIAKLLNQVDFTAEVVPTEDTERLVRLLTSLKGESLTEHEKILVAEIVHNLEGSL